MPRDSRTFTERARRQQLIEVTIGELAELGYARTSLARIAEAAGISKAAVLYHFTTKDAVVAAAFQAVLDELVAVVGAAVEAADPADRPAVYVRAMIGHLGERTDHGRVITEALTQRRGEADSPTSSEQRWQPVAGLLQDARAARGRPPLGDPRSAALALGGAIDAIVGENLRDPRYDSVQGATDLVSWLQHLLSR